jgi:hypothetical protein
MARTHLSSDSVSAEDKAVPVELKKYDTAGEVIQIDPIVDARVTRKFDNESIPYCLDFGC